MYIFLCDLFFSYIFIHESEKFIVAIKASDFISLSFPLLATLLAKSIVYTHTHTYTYIFFQYLLLLRILSHYCCHIIAAYYYNIRRRGRKDMKLGVERCLKTPEGFASRIQPSDIRQLAFQFWKLGQARHSCIFLYGYVSRDCRRNLFCDYIILYSIANYSTYILI